MFGVSFFELIVIMAVVLIVFGPEKLPEFARTFGKLMADLRRGSDSVRREFYNSVYKPADEFKRQIDTGARSLVTYSEEPAKKETPGSPDAGVTAPQSLEKPVPTEPRKDDAE